MWCVMYSFLGIFMVIVLILKMVVAIVEMIVVLLDFSSVVGLFVLMSDIR